MNSNSKTQEAPPLRISAEESKILAQIFSHEYTKIKNPQDFSYREILEFLDSLKILDIGDGSKISPEVRMRWNTFVEQARLTCVPRLRANARNLPPLNHKNYLNLKSFFEEISKAVPDFNWQQIQIFQTVQRKVQDILSKP